MTVQDLGDGLNGLFALNPRIKFAHFSWDPAPVVDYGVYAEEDESVFRTNNRHSEKTTIVYVNLFTRDDSGITKDTVELYFKSLEESSVTFAWYLNTIQYEEETKFIHIEWVVEFA